MIIENIDLKPNHQEIKLIITFEKNIYQEFLENKISVEELNQQVEEINFMTASLLEKLSAFSDEFPQAWPQEFSMSVSNVPFYKPE